MQWGHGDHEANLAIDISTGVRVLGRADFGSLWIRPWTLRGKLPVFHAPKACLPITHTPGMANRLLFSIRVCAWAMNSCFDSFILAVLVPLPGLVSYSAATSTTRLWPVKKETLENTAVADR